MRIVTALKLSLLLAGTHACGATDSSTEPPQPAPAVSIAQLPPPPCSASPLPSAVPSPKPVVMNNERLGEILEARASEISGGPGSWKFQVRIGGPGRTGQTLPLLCITDEKHDRMRIITPVLEVSKMKPDQLERVLEANFHTALDARYATHDGVLYSAFIHPLSPLTKAEVESAVEQVATLAASFGTAYSSGTLQFGR